MGPNESRRTIQEFLAKGKAPLGQGVREWGLFGLIFLVSVASFGLGRLSVLVEAKPLISVSEAASGAIPALAKGGYYVASRTGSTYYFPWCAGAEKIAPANERWFKTEAEAKAAGYRPAKNCKGLTVQ